MSDHLSVGRCPHCGQEMAIPQDELIAQKERINTLNSISARCKWHEIVPDHDASIARQRFKAILETCAEFEKKYGL